MTKRTDPITGLPYDVNETTGEWVPANPFEWVKDADTGRMVQVRKDAPTREDIILGHIAHGDWTKP